MVPTAPALPELNLGRWVRYLTITLRWILVAGGVFALTLYTVQSISDALSTKLYTATAQLELLPKGPVKSTGVDGPNLEATLQGEMDAIQSREVLLPVINNLDLDRTWAKRVFKSQQYLLSANDALAYLRKQLKIELITGTNIIKIIAKSDVPEEAAAIANAVVDQYKNKRDFDALHSDRNRDMTLTELIAQQQKVVEEKKAEVAKLPKDSPETVIAQHDLDQEMGQLDALNLRLRGGSDTVGYAPESAVVIVARAKVPSESVGEPLGLSRTLANILAAFLSLAAASFIEVALLLTRASERLEN